MELENDVVATATTDTDGRYAFDLTSLEGAFSVVFAQAWNTHIYEDDQVASWAWLDGAALSGTTTIEVVDLEISLVIDSQKFEQDTPAAAATFSAGQISPGSPLYFEWTPYPDATHYWMDLGKEGETTPVWQSILTLSPSAEFDGILDDGTGIDTGVYWWNIGAQKNVGIYHMTAYGHPRTLIIESGDANLKSGS